MKKLFFVLLSLCCSIFVMADDFSHYAMSFFGQEYTVQVIRGKKKINLLVYVQADLDKEGDVAYIWLWNKNIAPLQKAFMEAKDAFITMKAEAEASGKKDYSKKMAVKFPKLPLSYICKEGGLEHSFTRPIKVEPVFSVDKDGSCFFLITNVVNVIKETGNTIYTSQREFYIALKSVEEFDALIQELDPNR